jgi:hypothetical protein
MIVSPSRVKSKAKNTNISYTKQKTTQKTLDGILEDSRNIRNSQYAGSDCVRLIAAYKKYVNGKGGKHKFKFKHVD